MTFDETIELMLGLYKSNPKNRPWKIGLYVETKMWQFYMENYGENIAQMTYDVLRKYDLESIAKCENKLPIIIECFEGGSLMHFSNITDLPLIYLMNENYTTAMTMLPQIATYVHGIGPTQSLIFKPNFMTLAHSLDLQVHPYTL